MPACISLIKYTHQGISTIKAGPDRPDANKVILNRYGSELKAFYLTMGRYDAGQTVCDGA
ncbi:MAG TPA: GYD domain-containing protein [Streptosporangiaceae bacterium]|nr:GYD domain-containing protein [Streptosporangiaceae bacterium]